MSFLQIEILLLPLKSAKVIAQLLMKLSLDWVRAGWITGWQGLGPKCEVALACSKFCCRTGIPFAG
jgi:hypothetical protein